MKHIKRDNSLFLVDKEKTKEYYKNNYICNCFSCRNFRNQIKNISPQLTNFLSEFGVDICRPDNSNDIEFDSYIDYLFVEYTVIGNIVTEKVHETDIDNYHITISNDTAPINWVPNEQKDKCFFISITGITLPIILQD